MNAEDIAKHPRGSIVTIKARLNGEPKNGFVELSMAPGRRSDMMVAVECIDSIVAATPPDYTPAEGDRVAPTSAHAAWPPYCNGRVGTVRVVSSDAKECVVQWDAADDAPSRSSFFCPDEWGEWPLRALTDD